MKYLLLFLAVSIHVNAQPLVFKVPSPNRDYRAEVLAAIVQVEGVKNPDRRGPAGELTKYAFREATWKQYSKVPMYRATDVDVEKVAIKHYEWCRMAASQLSLRNARTGHTLAWAVALLWNAGYGTVEQFKVEPRHYDYAERVHNIVHPNAPIAK